MYRKSLWIKVSDKCSNSLYFSCWFTIFTFEYLTFDTSFNMSLYICSHSRPKCKIMQPLVSLVDTHVTTQRILMIVLKEGRNQSVVNVHWIMALASLQSCSCNVSLLKISINYYKKNLNYPKLSNGSVDEVSKCLLNIVYMAILHAYGKQAPVKLCKTYNNFFGFQILPQRKSLSVRGLIKFKYALWNSSIILWQESYQVTLIKMSWRTGSADPGILDYASKATVSRKITDKYPSEMFHEFKSKPLTESYFQ